MHAPACREYAMRVRAVPALRASVTRTATASLKPRCLRVRAVPDANERPAHHPQRASFSRRRPKLTSWADRNVDPARLKELKDEDIDDRLRNLGQAQHYNINVDHGQSSQYIDSLFTGNILGHKSDIADGSLRSEEFRTYNNIQGDYFIAPRFLDKVALHMGKNYLTDQLPSISVPLILGIWGPKGTGKTFQTELAFKKMGVEPVIMSAGELESDTAGDPSMLIRTRYRRAAEMSKINGKMSCLMINDIDAGLGRFDSTSATVNNQMTCATLMNICDTPTVVSVGGNWRGNDTVRRTPIIVTGNDLSTLFAPLIRDGRMDKFYWEPNLEEKTFMVHQMYKDDGLSFQDVIDLIAHFEHQPLDFFGALRASTFDKQILRWIKDDVLGEQDLSMDSNLRELSRRLVTQEGLPEFETMALTMEPLLEEGRRLTYEQDMVNQTRLSLEYMGLVLEEDEGEEELMAV